MEKQIITKLHKNFEEYAREKDGVEFWYARELQKLLGYDKWSNFEEKLKSLAEKLNKRFLIILPAPGK